MVFDYLFVTGFIGAMSLLIFYWSSNDTDDVHMFISIIVNKLQEVC